MPRLRSNKPARPLFDDPNLRFAAPADLDAINRVVTAAMATWDISERVRRLSLPLYRYGAEDLEFLALLVAERDGSVGGVAALEPLAGPAALLHGVYVAPKHQRDGIGSQLVHYAEKLARQRGFSEMRVRARPESSAFFTANDYRQLPQANGGSAYPWLMHKTLAASRR